MTDTELCAAINAYWVAYGITPNARLKSIIHNSPVSQRRFYKTVIVSDLRGTEDPG